MSAGRTIDLAIKALVAAAAPAAEVVGFDSDTSVPQAIGTGGMVMGFPGDPGEPEIDLSPLTYNYERRVQCEAAMPRTDEGADDAAGLDATLAAIGGAVASNRTLGGLCHWLEVTAAAREDRTDDGVTINWAEFAIVAHHATEHPLG